LKIADRILVQKTPNESKIEVGRVCGEKPTDMSITLSKRRLTSKVYTRTSSPKNNDILLMQAKYSSISFDKKNSY